MLRDSGFRRFWLAQVVSEAGSGVGGVALPLTAVLTLGASITDMGLLTALGTLPALLLSLHVGVWIDRLPARPILVVTNFARGVLLCSVPVAALAGWLRIEMLWAIAFVVGAFGVTFDIAVTSCLPALVKRNELIDANAKLQSSAAAARVVGPGIAGWIVQAISAPAGVAVDALSFLIAGALMGGVPFYETTPRSARRAIRSEIGAGIAAVWQDSILRPMVIATMFGGIGGAVQQAVYVLFAVDEVHLSPAVLGILVACGSLAGVVGAALAGRIARAFTAGGAMMLGQVGVVSSMVLVALATSDAYGVLELGLAQALFGAGLQIFSVTQISVRQAITPGHLLGRVNATRRVVVFGMQPLGALLGGFIGNELGLRHALVVAATIQIVALATILWSPLRRYGERSTTAI